MKTLILLFFTIPILAQGDSSLTVMKNLVNYSENDICTFIKKEVDDFTDKVTFSSPFTGKAANIYKIINGKETHYFLYLKTESHSLYVHEEGVKVLFTDGSKWESSTRIKVKVASEDVAEGIGPGEGYINSAFIGLSGEDLEIFSTKTIRKYRLYLHDHELPIDYATELMQYIECMKGLD